MKKLIAHFVAFAILAALGGVAFVWSGLYDISATDQHLRLTYHTIRRTMDRSVGRRASAIVVPPLDAPALLERGVALFRKHCVQCHGAPGVAPEPFALSLQPAPTPLARSGLDREPAYLYRVVKHGIKMTGMPAWDFRLEDEDLWAIVAFVRHLPTLSPPEYAALPDAGIARDDVGTPGEPDPRRGKRALEQYACVTCHEIPGMVGPEARLGPTLHGIGSRETLGGVLRNTPQNMARWIRSPRSFAPASAMPELGVTERDARDMAAHLATLR
jgi:mono/diheme cytochrome c family protein/cytochrome c2